MQTTRDIVMPALTRSFVRDEWIDSNEHMNSAMYLVAFRDASAPVLHKAGMDHGYIERTGCAVVQREAHIRYVRELRRGDPILMRSWVAGVDKRSVHVVTEMLHGEAGWLAASVELLYTHFNRRTRRSEDWPEAMAALLREQMAAGAGRIPREAIGRRTSVRDN